MSRIIMFWTRITLGLLFSVNLSAAQDNGQPISLHRLLEEALQNNPAIKGAERRWRAEEARPAQVTALPDPMFSYARFGSSVETRVGPQENVFALSQRIPFPGKLGLQGEMAKQDALAAEQKYEATKRDVVFRVKSAYYDLYWIDQSIVILNRYLALLEDFTRVAEQKYATGQGIQASVLKSQVEISSMLKRRLGFEKLRAGAAARLNALLDRSSDATVAPAAQIDSTRSPLELDSLIARALAQREELQALQAMVDKSEFMRRLAKKSYWPDFNLKANYIDVRTGLSAAPDAGKNAWSVMFGLNLPIWLGKRKAAVREAHELTAANKLTYENLENQIKAEIKELAVQFEITDRTLDLYEQGLLTQAKSSLESAMASYRTGRLDFLNLLDAERMLLNLNLSYVKEQTSYQKQLAALERAVGGELPQ
ncbi:MAG: TolC family protein [bacterium]